MSLIGKLANGTAWVGEKTIGKLYIAVPTSLFSVNEPYNFWLRPLGGGLDTLGITYDLVRSLITNQGTRDVAGDTIGELFGALASIVNNPFSDAGLTALYAFGVCKATPYVLRKIRKKSNKSGQQITPTPTQQ